MTFVKILMVSAVNSWETDHLGTTGQLCGLVIRDLTLLSIGLDVDVPEK